MVYTMDAMFTDGLHNRRYVYGWFTQWMLCLRMVYTIDAMFSDGLHNRRYVYGGFIRFPTIKNNYNNIKCSVKV